MPKLIFVFSLAATLCTVPAFAGEPQSADAGKGPCPGAYIDYEHAKPDPFGPGVYIPVQVQVRARRALRKCAKDGIAVPYTVAEYNNRRALNGYSQWQIKRAITVPAERWGE